MTGAEDTAPLVFNVYLLPIKARQEAVDQGQPALKRSALSGGFKIKVLCGPVIWYQLMLLHVVLF